MDAFIDSTTWHYMLFARTGNGSYWRIWFDGNEPLMERLFGDEPQYYEPLKELRERAAAHGQ
jgi:hypothetical protein